MQPYTVVVMNMEYLTAKEAGEKWSLTARMVNYYCSAGRIVGAAKKGNLWLIPSSAEKPSDMRKENSRKPKA
jgi:Mrp family chromosome partitioning ATPase